MYMFNASLQYVIEIFWVCLEDTIGAAAVEAEVPQICLGALEHLVPASSAQAKSAATQSGLEDMFEADPCAICAVKGNQFTLFHAILQILRWTRSGHTGNSFGRGAKMHWLTMLS